MEHAWNKLLELQKSDNATICWIPVDVLDFNLPKQVAAVKGMPENSVVRIDCRAMKLGTTANSQSISPLRYARYALLETIIPTNSSDTMATTTTGIQVLNFVIFPSVESNLPVWGIDLVSLPGDKHLLAVDAQPMTTAPTSTDVECHSPWQEWYQTHVVDRNVEWGGEMPEAVEKFFSPHAFWTRLKGDKDAIQRIQTEVYEAFCHHLVLYLAMVEEAANKESTDTSSSHNHQQEYLDYRLANDPARPMLHRLYGEEWSEKLLTEILFPKLFN
jgi:phycoerythrobilin:ferredoxin oxidoreductase